MAPRFEVCFKPQNVANQRNTWKKKVWRGLPASPDGQSGPQPTRWGWGHGRPYRSVCCKKQTVQSSVSTYPASFREVLGGRGRQEGRGGGSGLPVELRDDFSHSLGGAGGGWDDVLRGAASVPPQLPRRAVDGLLGGSDGVDGALEAEGEASSSGQMWICPAGEDGGGSLP